MPTSAIIAYADVPWQIHHQQDPTLPLVTGTILAPVCAQGTGSTGQQQVYMPLVLR
ncbi:MAG: hypothetical protein HC938_17725 [Nitrospira sp.]|nr:hypothetical protein [Nitrospira sp.]